MKKALIVCGKLLIGGAEKVAYLIGENATQYEYECHYIVFEDIVGEYEEELIKKGCEIFHIPVPSQNYYHYWKYLNMLMHENAYDVVHCHTMFNSGIVMLAAKKNNVPCRITHSHSICSSSNRKISKRIYERLMRYLILKNATAYVGCGKNAGEWLFGEKAYDQKGITILNGVNTKLFKYDLKSREKIRKKYEIGNKFVIGHVGHLLEVKNQAFILHMMPEILKRNPDATLFLIGEGKDRQMLEQLIQELGLSKNVIMTGNVMNVYDYLSAMDVFVFPSLYEGMPLSILEVQSNGLPCVISDAVPKDVYLTDLLTVMSLKQPKEEWIEAVFNAKRNESDKYCNYMYEAGYDTEMMIKKVYTIYNQEEM